jgi:hypothetical protein
LLDHLMDMNNTPEPRMPLVENFEFLHLVGVISSPCTMVCARTSRSRGIPCSIALRRTVGRIASVTWLGGLHRHYVRMA